MRLPLYKSFFISGLTTLVSYSLTIFLTYRLVPGDYGVYLLAIAWAGFLGVFVDWSTTFVFSHLAEKSRSLSEAISTTLYLRLINFILIAFFIIFSEALGQNIPKTTLIFLIGTFNLGFLFEYKRQNVKFALLTLLEKSLFVIMVYVISNWGLSVINICLCFMLSAFISLTLQYLHYKADIKNMSGLNFNNVSQYMTGYFHYFIISITQLSYGITSRLILQNKLGLEIFVFFSLALQLISLASVFQSQADRVFRPEIITSIVSKNRKGLNSLLRSYFFFFLTPMAVLTCIVYFFAQTLIASIFGPDYLEVSLYVALLSPLFITVPVVRLVDHLMLATDSFKINLGLNVCVSLGLIGTLTMSNFANGFQFSYAIIAWHGFHGLAGFILIHQKLKVL